MHDIDRKGTATEKSWKRGCVGSAVFIELKKMAENITRFATTKYPNYCLKTLQG